MGRRGRIIRYIWAACLVLAGLNHARILVQHGLFWDYGGVAWPSAVYWSSLTIIDPLVALLLVIRPVIGVPMTAAVITTNVIHNLAITAFYRPDGAFLDHLVSSPQIMSQIGFLVFVILTIRMALGGIGKDILAPASPMD
ncbi:hypothetical protein ASE75_05925 [Sphingomonas sp. Leaf17]|uniref:hypothetical protein n=1 Tax=Sphingomonas sp. Leaf17 TaxID=1735683 RepID=UPI0006F8485C|nr:hypothetical protein [Sphingomonas sp. Leaf17]KQM65767.1 hypothetical protein ASE75_05925 [Sphingomonas sp. Leaf17]